LSQERGDARSIARALASSAPVACVSVDYRLAPNTHLKTLDEAWRRYAHRRHPARFGIDGNALGICGETRQAPRSRRHSPRNPLASAARSWRLQFADLIRFSIQPATTVSRREFASALPAFDQATLDHDSCNFRQESNRQSADIRRCAPPEWRPAAHPRSHGEFESLRDEVRDISTPGPRPP